ncbi:hypothetical protein THRCLA_07157 [Thraustotheca clavata]|uniref:Uncharacterized protein n=1 Tax=Thraustotheca clavata TaxID=74557 RepID=A0A1V9ZFQ7_9STRA|nr:hypothetical protein THRCLA_07157 [Thraustotheca clavata]
MAGAGDALLLVDVGQLRGHELQKEVSLLLLPQVDWSSESSSVLEAAAELLVSPLSLLVGDAPVPADRTLLQKGSISVRMDASATPSTVPVIPAIQQQVIEMANELHVAEKTCLKYWILASDADNRMFVTHRNRLPPQLLRDNVPRAAREFLLTETNAIVTALFELSRARHSTTMAADKKDAILNFTNGLLQKDLLGNLCCALNDHIPTLLKNKTIHAMAMVWQKAIAECILLLSASTLVLPTELKQLTTLALGLGTRCQTISASVTTVLQGALGLSTEESPYDFKEVASHLHALSYVHAAIASTLQTSDPRIHRDTNENAVASAAWTADVKVSQEILNQLKAPSTCKFHGLLFILGAVALAQFQSKLTFVMESDITALHDAALKHNSFSLLVQLLFPFAPESPVLLNIFSSAFEDFFSSYIQLLFPNHKDGSLVPRAAAGAVTPIFSAQLSSPDDLSQVMESAVALSKLNSPFANTFWSVHQPFLQASATLSQQSNTSRLAYMHLLAACATGCPELAYKHIKDSPPPVTWKHFFAAIDNYRRVLMHEPTLGSVTAPLTTTTTATPHRFKPEEVQALNAMLSIFQSVLENPAIVHFFLDWPDNNVLLLFLSFLRCSIPSVLKGAVMQTLSRFVISAPLAQLLWQHLEAAQILTTTASTTTTGIQFELEQIESMQRTYPATTGFLALLRPLFTYDFPEECGASYRVSGNRPYMDFVVDHVFLKITTREFDSDMEKWTLLEHVLGLFHDVLRRYDPTASDFLDEYAQITPANGGNVQHVLKPKSSGFYLMYKLLTDSNVMRQLFTLLPTVETLEQSYETQHATYTADLCMQLVQPEDSLRPLNATHKRQECVHLILDMLSIVMLKESKFLSLLRESGLQDRSAEPLANLLSRVPVNIVKATMYTRYTQAPIASLAIKLLSLLGQNIPSPSRLVEIYVDAGVADSMCDGIVSSLMDPSSTLRESILDLLLDNLSKPLPNLGTFLLGWPTPSMKAGSIAQGANALDAILLFLDNPSLIYSAPVLAEKCYLLILKLLSSTTTLPLTLQRLGHPTLNCFFHRQAHMLPVLVPSQQNFVKKHRDQLALVRCREWLLESLALWLFHAKCPEVAKWFTSQSSAQIPLLSTLEGTPFLMTPPERPSDAHSLSLAEQCTLEKDNQLLIDIPAFQSLLERDDTSAWARPTPGVQDTGSNSVIQWALNWNRYSERIAAEAKALQAWRKLTEVIVLQYATPVQSLQLILDFTLSILQMPGLVAHLVELAAKATVALSFQLRGALSKASSSIALPQRILLLERTIKALQSTLQTTGNPAAARRARSSLYTCYLHVTRFIDSESGPSPAPSAGNHLVLLSPTPSQPKVSFDAAFVSLVCRDATDITVPLTMGLAMNVLESLLVSASDKVLPLLSHQIPHLCGVILDDPKASTALIIPSVLSLWIEMATTKDGALALLHGGAIRALMQISIPSRPMKPHSGSLEAYVSADQAFFDKWLPVLRLLATMCASLPQHTELMELLVQALLHHWKRVSSSLKLDDSINLNRLTELSLVTYLFKTLASFPQILEAGLTVSKVYKITTRLVNLIPYFGLHVVHGGWWQQLVPRTISEQERNDIFVSTKWTFFGQSALYASRLTLCHTLAFCRLRMLSSSSSVHIKSDFVAIPLFDNDKDERMNWNAWKSCLDAWKAALFLSKDATCDAEFHHETMVFLIEHIVTVLSLHCLHYQNATQAKSILALLGTDFENYSFVHVLSRKLREICQDKP